MEFGLCTIALSDKPILEALDIAHRCGCDGVEIWGKDGHLPPEVSDEEIERVKKLCEERNLQIITYGSYLRLLSDEFEQSYRRVVDCADTLGARMIRIWAGHISSKDATDDIVDTAAEQLQKLGDYADDKDLLIVIENHDNSLADNSQMILRLINQASRKNVKSYWQPSFRGDREDWYQSLRNLLPVLAGIHAQNYSGEYTTRKQTFNGDVDYTKIASILKEHDIHCPIFVEFPAPGEPAQTIADDINYLKSIFNF